MREAKDGIRQILTQMDKYMKTYSEEQISSIIHLLNNLEVKGIDNATRVVMISKILENCHDSSKKQGTSDTEE